MSGSGSLTSGSPMSGSGSLTSGSCLSGSVVLNGCSSEVAPVSLTS